MNNIKTKINIAEILRNKSHGVKLYSPIFGDCTYCYIHDELSDICVKRPYNVISYFNFEGLYNTAGECLLFPSKDMRDWSKFAWKMGDTLSCGVDNLCIFEKWANKEYTKFYAKFVTPNYSDNTFKTEKWSKETNEAVIKQYISNIEEFKGGKLNLTTLEIEKIQPEFKDGDVVVVDKIPFDLYSKCIFILKKNLNTDEIKARAYVLYNINKDIIFFDTTITKLIERNIHLATDEEKQRLFDALVKKNKAWDAKKKQIVDLKPKYEFKPFDRVITRVDDDAIWTSNIFSHMDSHGGYVPIGCVDSYPYCLPYNEETAKLVGTTNNVED